MSLTSQDVAAFARRIRPHFEPPLQDVAEEFALLIAQTAGTRVKQLRPETTLDEILGWLGTDSLDHIEVMMDIEEKLKFEIPDDMADRSATTTFRYLVVRLAAHRHRGAL